MHRQHVRHRGVQIGHGQLAVSQQLRGVQSIGGHLHVQVRSGEEARLYGLQSQRHDATCARVQAHGQVEQNDRVLVRAHRVADEVARVDGHQTGRVGLEDTLHVVDQVTRGDDARQSRQDSRRARSRQRSGDTRRRHYHAANAHFQSQTRLELLLLFFYFNFICKIFNFFLNFLQQKDYFGKYTHFSPILYDLK